MAAEAITIQAWNPEESHTGNAAPPAEEKQLSRCCVPQGGLAAICHSSGFLVPQGSNSGKVTGTRHIFGAGSLATPLQITVPTPVFIAVSENHREVTRG